MIRRWLVRRELAHLGAALQRDYGPKGQKRHANRKHPEADALHALGQALTTRYAKEPAQ